MDSDVRKHSIKVPRLYKVSAGILREFNSGKDSIKNLLFNSKKKHPNTKAVYALVMEAVNRRAQIETATERVQLFINEPRFDKALASVLICELVWGKQTLPGESLPIHTVLRYKRKLTKCLNNSTEQVVDGRALSASWPRYARVNPLVSSLSIVHQQLQSEGWQEIQYNIFTTKFSKFLSLVKKLKPDTYIVDLHLPDLLVFPPKSELYNHNLVTEGSLLLQDKSSCFPVTCLAPPPGITVLDTCSAPGMKTSQIAGMVAGDKSQLQGRVIAVERSSKRCDLLRQILSSTQADKVTTVVNQDFLTMESSQLSDAEMAVVDPSCSGTGMVMRGGGDEDPSQDRLEKLAELQVKLLRHAMSLSNVRRVVYSTCAVSMTENENVVERVLEATRGWRVADGILPAWPRRGLGESDDRDKFIRVLPEEDLSNGFFVAVLEKTEQYQENIIKKSGKVDRCEQSLSDPEIKLEILNEAKNISTDESNVVETNCDLNLHKPKKEKPRKNENVEVNDEGTNTSLASETDVNTSKKSHKKKKNKYLEENDEDINTSFVAETDDNISKKSHKKKNKHFEENCEDTNTSFLDEIDVNNSKKSHKKKRKNLEVNDEDTKISLEVNDEDTKISFENETDDNTSKKSHKKKKYLEVNGEDTNTSFSVETDNKTSKKSHKKKTKNLDVNDEDTNISFEDEPDINTSKKSHKKKNKYLDVNGENANTPFAVEMDDNTSKKSHKKKKKYLEVKGEDTNTLFAVETDEKSSKKSHKKRKYLEVKDEDTNIPFEDEPEDNTFKKLHKKKNKHLEVNGEDANTSFAVETNDNTSKKSHKKKRKNREVNDEDSNISFEVETDDNTSNQSHKKNKIVEVNDENKNAFFESETDNNTSKKSQKKKNKHLEENAEDTNSSLLVVTDDITSKKSHKKKKKHKHDIADC